MDSFATLTWHPLPSSPPIAIHMSSPVPPPLVAVLGAAGGISQPLSLLCNISPKTNKLSCYNIIRTPGDAADHSQQIVHHRRASIARVVATVGCDPWWTPPSWKHQLLRRLLRLLPQRCCRPYWPWLHPHSWSCSDNRMCWMDQMRLHAWCSRIWKQTCRWLP